MKKQHIRILAYTLLYVLISTPSFSQNPKLDSLQIALKNAKHDSTKLRLKFEIGEAYSIFRSGFWDSLATEAKKINAKKLHSDILNNIGFIYYNEGDISNARAAWKQSLAIQVEIIDKPGESRSLNNLGAIYEYQGDIPKALDHYERSLKIRELVGDKEGVAGSLNNIGLIYSSQNDHKKALEYLTRSLKIDQELDDKSNIANVLANIGLVYSGMKDFQKSLAYYKRSLNILEELGDKKGISSCLRNIGAIYANTGDNTTALEYYLRSLEIAKAIKSKKGIALLFNHIAGTYISRKKYPEAREYADSALVLAKELGFPKIISDSEIRLSKIDSATGNYAGALAHHKKYVFYNDSINNEKTRKASLNNQLKYEYEKKEAVLNEQQAKERAVTEQKSLVQQIAILCVALGLMVVIAFAMFMLRSLKTTRFQKIIIEEKQKEILDSIRYAKRIQKSLLPTEKYIQKNLNRLTEK